MLFAKSRDYQLLEKQKRSVSVRLAWEPAPEGGAGRGHSAGPLLPSGFFRGHKKEEKLNRNPTLRSVPRKTWTESVHATTIPSQVSMNKSGIRLLGYKGRQVWGKSDEWTGAAAQEWWTESRSNFPTISAWAGIMAHLQ